MKTGDLLVGLFQVFGGLGLLFVPYGMVIPEGNYRAAVALALLVACAVNGWQGGRRVMEALFGDEGLLLDFGRHLELRYVRRERRDRPPGERVRTTNPSRKLRDRGAEPRFRCRFRRRAG
jgi:hypothetical protein